MSGRARPGATFVGTFRRAAQRVRDASWPKRVRFLLALLAGAYLVTVFFPQGWDKFDSDGFWAEPFVRWGYPVWLRGLVGVLETGGSVMLVIPWLATWGGLATGVVMAGALYTRLPSGFWVDVAWIALWLVTSLWIAWEWREWRWPRRRGSSDMRGTSSSSPG